jgi:D-alanine-D-alanine ligase
MAINTINFGKVGVLLGGDSAEREISILSGNAIFDGLRSNGIEAVKIDTKNGLLEKIKNENIDRAFVALHGRGGEDGTIQGFLEMLKIPFTGSDTASSAIAMNKLVSKQIWTTMGLKTAKFSQVQQKESFDYKAGVSVIERLGEQLFVKPVREGSSVGMSKVCGAEELATAVKKAQEFDHVLIEEFIDGDEYTVGILGNETLPSINMRTPNEYYDYDAKYCTDTTKYFCPSGLNERDEAKVCLLALEAFSSLGCSGWGRIDFIRRKKDGEFLLLEANTIPGMTQTSLVPKAALAKGLSFSDLVREILLSSFDATELSCG